jgi:hypothetical protein
MLEIQRRVNAGHINSGLTAKFLKTHTFRSEINCRDWRYGIRCGTGVAVRGCLGSAFLGTGGEIAGLLKKK